MFEYINTYVKDNIIEVNGEDYPLGKLTESSLNITPKEYEEIRNKMWLIVAQLEDEDEMKTGLYGIPDSSLETEILQYESSLIGAAGKIIVPIPKEERLSKIKTLVREICEVLIRHKIFKAISKENIFEYLDGIDRAGREEFNGHLWRDYSFFILRLHEIIDDLFSFNQTIFWFIDRFISVLGDLHPSGFAAAYYDYINDPWADKMIVNPMRNHMLSYTNFDEMDMRLIPRETSEGSKQFVIAEYYRLYRLQSFLKLDFLKALSVGHHIRRCQNCKRFFLLTKAYYTKYCDKPSPDDPRLTCQQSGYKKTRKKENKADDPKLQSYKRCKERIRKAHSRGTLSEAEKDKLLRAAEEIYTEAVTTSKYSNEQLEALLQTDSLYPRCCIKAT